MPGDNADSLNERLDAIDAKISRMRPVLEEVPQSIVNDWKMPVHDGSIQDLDDPNALCVPQADDYVLFGGSGIEEGDPSADVSSSSVV